MVHAGCAFVAGILLSRTWMSGYFEPVRWNACVHRLDLGLYPHPKEFLGSGVRTHINCKETSRLPEAQRRVKPATLHHAGQQAQHTTGWAIPTHSSCGDHASAKTYTLEQQTRNHSPLSPVKITALVATHARCLAFWGLLDQMSMHCDWLR